MTVVSSTFSSNATFRAVVDRMLPADDWPSGMQAGVGDFIDRIFETELVADSGAFTAALASLDAEAAARVANATFPDLSLKEQDSLLADLAHGFVATHWPSDASAFVDLLARLCAQGFYGDPGNGGNRDSIGWRMVGYRELPDGVMWPEPEPAPAPVIEASSLRHHYDAIVIGAGAGGCVAASELAEAGLTVLIVERARAHSSLDLRLDHLRSERSVTGYATQTGPSRNGEPRVLLDALGRHEVDAPDLRWSANAMSVGGGTRVYGAQAWRFCDEDFHMASRYGVPEGSSLADWPLDYAELEPWYDRVEWELGVSGNPAGNRFAGHRARDYPMPPLPQTLSGHALAHAARRLEFTVGAVPLLINSKPRFGRPACVQCGSCVGFACQAGAKNGSFNTALPRALATGRCDLLTGAHTTRIQSDSTGVATGVDIALESDVPEHRITVEATYLVVAAGAIESARLMLNSPTSREPNGLGNAQDQVGRNLQAHVYAGAIGLFDEVVQDSVGPGPSISTNDFRHGNEGFVGGGMIANDFVPIPLNVWDTLSKLGVIERFGAASKAGMRRLWSRMQMVFGPVQEMPNCEARVQTDDRVVDRFGVPVAVLSGDIHNEDRRTARFLADRAADWLTEAGAHTVVRVTADDRPEGPSGGQHQAGTLRMGDDPASSVTDRWGRVWDHPNVLVADGSVHVTNGGVNPVLTIMALAMRNSAHLAEEWKVRDDVGPLVS